MPFFSIKSGMQSPPSRLHVPHSRYGGDPFLRQ